MKIAAGYIRVSTEEQVEYSPESQRKLLIQYAKAHDMILPEDYIFSDEGISGRSTKRPAFQKMIGLAKTKPAPFEVILVWKFSRFARNREDSIVYKSMLRKQCGIEVISISEPVGEDKMSVLIEAMIEAMDEYYSLNLAEEVRRGMTEKAKRGGNLGGAPFGFQVTNGVLTKNPDTAPIAEKLFQDYLSGKSLMGIAVELNTLGIPTKYGRQWTAHTVNTILSNPAYCGTSHWTPGGDNGVITEDTIQIENAHEAIVSKETFDKVQEKLAAVRKIYARHAHPNHGEIYALKGIVRCDNCGMMLVNASYRGSMQCRGYSARQCSVSHCIRKDKLFQMIINQLYEDISTEHFNFAVKVEPDQKQDDGREMFQARLKKLEMQLDRVKEAYASGIDTLDEYRENKARIQAQMQAVGAELNAVPEVQQDSISKVKAAVESSLEVLESDIPEHMKNEILRGLVDKIIYIKADSRVEIFYRRDL